MEGVPFLWAPTEIIQHWQLVEIWDTYSRSIFFLKLFQKHVVFWFQHFRRTLLNTKWLRGVPHDLDHRDDLTVKHQIVFRVFTMNNVDFSIKTGVSKNWWSPSHHEFQVLSHSPIFGWFGVSPWLRKPPVMGFQWCSDRSDPDPPSNALGVDGRNPLHGDGWLHCACPKFGPSERGRSPSLEL